MLQAQFDWACSWMVVLSASCRPSTQHISTGLSRIQHLNINMDNLEFLNIRRWLCSYGGCHGIFNETLSAIPWQAAYGPGIKESMYPKRENSGRGSSVKDKWNTYSLNNFVHNYLTFLVTTISYLFYYFKFTIKTKNCLKINNITII